MPGIYAVVPLVGLGIVAWCMKREWDSRHKTPCDMCANLKMKDTRDFFTYHCAMYGVRRYAPQYCAGYKPGEEEDHA